MPRVLSVLACFSITPAGVALAQTSANLNLRMVQPLHFFVEDALIQHAPLTRWNDELSRVVAAADQLLCEEMMRAEKALACDLSLRGAVSVTGFDRTFEEGLHRTADGNTRSHSLPPGAVNQDGVNYLLDQTEASERRIFVVRRILSCGGNQVESEACTRLHDPATVIALNDPSTAYVGVVTLLHELGHQVGLHDVPDPRSLMYAGRPVPRAGTKLSAVEAGAFYRLLPPS